MCLNFPSSFKAGARGANFVRLCPPLTPGEPFLWEREAPLPWDHLSGASTPAYLQQMFAARFAVHTTSRPRWGNWAIEAAQAGSLFLGNFGSLAHLSLCLPGLDCRTLSQAARRIARLLENPDALRLLQKRQADLAEHLAFRRPLADLTRIARLFFDR
jgi:hypothetical protein